MNARDYLFNMIRCSCTENAVHYSLIAIVTDCPVQEFVEYAKPINVQTTTAINMMKVMNMSTQIYFAKIW